MEEIKANIRSLDAKRLSTLRSESDTNALMYGRVQPQAVSLEEAVLGALMLDKDAISVIIDILKPDSFYHTSHALIYSAIHKLFEKSEPIDLLTVTEQLRKSGDLDLAGGPAFLVALTNKVGSAANAEFHARIVAQKYIQRELIRVSTSIITDSYEDSKDIFELLDDAEKNLFEITEKNLRRNYVALGELAIESRKQIEELSQKEDGLTGVPSGFTDLDKMTNGWQPSDLIILAARPGMGKTAFTLALAANAAKDHKKPIAVFSLEMSNVQLTNRLISSEAEISGTKLRSGKLEEYEWQQLNKAVETLNDVPIFIDDTPAINIFELRAKCRRLKMQHDIQMIVIDYLQLMTGSPDNNRGGNREQEISSISRALKGLAKELNVPVIALSQLSRAVETRGGPKRPMLSDLRESGAIEQDADIVTFLYRPGYYDMEEEEGAVEGLTEVILAKHRNGALGTVNLKFIGEYAKFVDLDGDFSSLANDLDNQRFNMITKSSRMNSGNDDVPF